MIRSLALIFLAAVSLPLWGANEARVPDEIIVKYKSLNRFADHGPVMRRPNRHIEVLRHDGGRFQAAGKDKWASLHDKIAQIKKDPNVLYAEPNYLGHFEETVPQPPSDPSYASQWWLPAVGDRTMWALGRGSGVVVAVIDTGVDLTHPDLAANLLANGKNYGDAIDGNASPQDLLGHGTRVAGIIAARQNNGIGVSGLAPEAKILPIKINPGAEGTFTSDRLGSAIDYAVSQGAKIINLSLTVDNQTQTVRDALQAAMNAGVAVVAAAGNAGGAVEFPATMTGVIGVAATDPRGHLNTLAANDLKTSIGNNINLTSVTLSVVPPTSSSAHPVLGMGFNPATINVGGVSTLTITLSNPNTSVATLNTTLTDTLPSGVVLSSTPNASTTCGGTGALLATAGGSTVILPATRSIPAGSSCTVTVDVTTQLDGGYLNTLAAHALQTSSGNSIAPASATLTVVPSASPSAHPLLGVSFNPATINAGGVSTLTITLSNPNTNVGTLSFDFTDILPAGMVLSATPNANTTCSGTGTLLVSGGGSTITLPATRSIPAGSSCTVTVDVTALLGSNDVFALASFSNFGPEVTLAAPGTSIVSTLLGGGYGLGADGTSFAAPIVSAALADVVSINPTLPSAAFARYLRANTKIVSGGTYPFGTLDAGQTGNSLVPHLLLSKSQFSAAEPLSINYALPPTGGAVDVYVAVQTPVGEFALHPDGRWTAAAESGYVPFAIGYRSDASLSGTLFGVGGILNPISLSGLPAGAYTWRTALLERASGKIIGDVITSTMQLQ